MKKAVGTLSGSGNESQVTTRKRDVFCAQCVTFANVRGGQRLAAAVGHLLATHGYDAPASIDDNFLNFGATDRLRLISADVRSRCGLQRIRQMRLELAASMTAT